ncbi:serine/threonine protein kinase, partial [Micromonospora chalcea]
VYPDLMPPAAAARAWSRAAKRSEWAPPAEGDQANPAGPSDSADLPGPSGESGRSGPSGAAARSGQSGRTGPVDRAGQSGPVGSADRPEPPPRPRSEPPPRARSEPPQRDRSGELERPEPTATAPAEPPREAPDRPGPVSLGPTVLTSFVDPGSPTGPESAPRADTLSPVRIAGPDAAPVARPAPVAHSGPADSGALRAGPPPPTGVPRPADRPLDAEDQKRLQRWGLAVGAVLLAVATGVGTALAVTDGADDHPEARRSGEAVVRPWDHQPGPGVPPPPFPCVRPDVAGTPIRKGPPPEDPAVNVPAGWVWPADTGGFHIALPAGWLQLRSGDTTCFQDPATRRILGVEPYPGGDPVGRLRSSERDLTSAGRLSQYEKIRLAADGPGAEWECRWTAPYGERMHALRVLPGQRAGWTLGLTTSDADWAAASKQFAVIRASLGTVRPTRTAG